MPKILNLNLIKPLDPISNVQEIQRIEENVKELQRYCQRNPDYRKMDSTRNLVSSTNKLQRRERECACERSANL